MGNMEDIMKMIFGMVNNLVMKNINMDLKDIVYIWVIVYLMINVEKVDLDLLNLFWC